MNNLSVKIVKAGLLVGTLDILSAFLHYYIKTHDTHFLGIFKFIASGAVGKEQADAGDSGMILMGLFLHYAIAFSFTIFFFWIYPKVKILSTNRVLTGIAYGLFIWMVMNLIIVPLSNVPPRPFTIANATINVVILMVCVGIPLSFMAAAYYHNASNNTTPVNDDRERN
jgi:hypothetical protein